MVHVAIGSQRMCHIKVAVALIVVDGVVDPMAVIVTLQVISGS